MDLALILTNYRLQFKVVSLIHVFEYDSLHFSVFLC